MHRLSRTNMLIRLYQEGNAEQEGDEESGRRVLAFL